MLARGKLTRDWDATTNRSETDEFGRTLYRDSDAQIGEAVARSLPWRPSSQDAQLSTVQVGAGSQFGRGTFGA